MLKVQLSVEEEIVRATVPKTLDIMPKNRNKKTAQSSKSGGGANIIIRQSAGSAENAPTSQSAQIKIEVDDQKLEDIVQKHQPPKPPTQSEQDNTKGEANAGMMNAITGALLGVIPMADKHLGSTASGNDHSLLDLGEEAQTLKRFAFDCHAMAWPKYAD